ncbi:MAG: hypothetical protein IJD68_04160 [Ruminococcus sp.]|nr:hypothetical protein [Ruminococcus sp.]
MKKLLTVTLIIMLCVLCTSCAFTTTQEPTEDISTHTIPPTQDQTVAEEWAEIDCDIKLLDADGNTVVGFDDFETFTLSGTNDDDSCIKVKLSETATQMLCSLPEPTQLYIYISDEKIAPVNIDPATFNGEIAFGSDLSFDKLCELATAIRGLFN